MEHGLQTHTVPEKALSQQLIARRMGFLGPEAQSEFSEALKSHPSHVRQTYDRLFGGSEHALEDVSKTSTTEPSTSSNTGAAVAKSAARVFEAHLEKTNGVSALARLLQTAAEKSLNPHRSLMQVSRIAASLEKSEIQGP